ncbi:MAG: hypothetical protein L0154_22135 [Chloroflexi bacterium]|nr:hypothetical protein [Chloroflexota bacterium]
MMFKRIRVMIFLMIVLAFSMSKLTVTAQDGDQIICEETDGEAEELEEVFLYIEYNYTDGDIGVHGLFDGDGWSKLCVYAPDGTQILGVAPQGQLGGLGISGIFFESREPELDEFGVEDLFATFPEGEYEVRGTTFDGVSLTGVATFTHNVPAPPTIIQPAELGEDDEEGREVILPRENFVVEWEPVTETINGDPVEILGYEVIVTADDYVALHGFNQPIFDVHLPADRTSLSISPEFLDPGTLYEIEILSLEASGNQTISLGFFTTE